MQGKGLIIAIAIILGLICLNEIAPTIYVKQKENEALALSKGNDVQYQKELQKISKDTLSLFGLKEFNYNDAKQSEMKLGLDLKGGINVLLEINQRDLVNDLTNYSTNPTLIEALNRTNIAQRNSSNTYINDFFKQFALVNKEKGTAIKLSNPEVFGTQKLSSEIKFNTSDTEVEKIIKSKIEASVASAFEVIRTRIDKLGVTQPNVQRVAGTGRILVEMPGIKDIDRVKKLLQTSARLQFWEVQTVNEVFPYFTQISNLVGAKKDSLKLTGNINLEKMLQLDKIRSYGVGVVKLMDTATVNKIINAKFAIDGRPSNMRFTKFMWAHKPEVTDPTNLTLYAIRGTANGKAPLDGAVKESRIKFDEMNRVQIEMQMDSEGTRVWKNLTEKNIGKPIAVVLDDLVYTAPNVNSAIPNGQSIISGSYSQTEAKDLVDVLNSGKLSASSKIVQAEVVGPSLGEESIQSGLLSFVAAFIIIMIWVIFYYGGAGIYAVICMTINLFFVVGIMDSIGATLTLPGIAGIVLTMAMAVDTNVIIFERTKEELRLGKDMLTAYNDGFKHALSAIIDRDITSMLTAIVLLVFGTGPIKGFAVTLLIGLFMSFFTSVLLARVLIFSRLEKGKSLSVWTSVTKNWFVNARLNFIEKRKIAYIVSAILTTLCLISIAVNGFKLGVDFNGGRNYVIRLNKDVNASQVERDLAKYFQTADGKDNSVDVKTFGKNNQVKIVTDYKINDESLAADQEIENKLYKGLQSYLPQNYQFENFKSTDKSKIGIVSSSRVGPTVADDITTGGFLAVGISLIGIFIYLLIRFNKWQFS